MVLGFTSALPETWAMAFLFILFLDEWERDPLTAARTLLCLLVSLQGMALRWVDSEPAESEQLLCLLAGFSYLSVPSLNTLDPRAPAVFLLRP